MTHDDAMAGHPISFQRAAAEVKAHGQFYSTDSAEGTIKVWSHGEDEVTVLPLNTKAIMEWLGY